jgi:hypothetical protein
MTGRHDGQTMFALDRRPNFVKVVSDLTA